MPATEKTWRDQSKMHVLFGISALVMLVGTIWMLAKDHNREWREWQLEDRARERWTIQAQLAQAQADSSAQLKDLRKELAAAQSAKVNPALVTQFKELVRNQEKQPNFTNLDADLAKLEGTQSGSKAAANARKTLLNRMDSFAHEAKRRENSLTTKKKLVAADQTADISARGIAVGEGKPTGEIDQRIEKRAGEMVQIDASLASATDYRVALEGVVKQIQSTELDLQKKIQGLETEQKRLASQLPGALTRTGEWINRGPILDALYTGDIKLDQIWLPDLKINYNFSSVARYDRCIVCHRSIDKTAPGSASDPAYPAIPRSKRDRVVQLATPAEAPKGAANEDFNEALVAIYGIRLADRGQVDPKAVTIQVVTPDSLAASAGLQMGDILLEANGGPIDSQDAARHYLLDIADWGKPIALKIRRGLNQPFTSHPRLDLFVGSTSPHKMQEMGCTICHDGQGSATDFKWASHTPDDPQQALDWSRTYGWFDNHNWGFPMTPERFVESNCLKCHHEVTDLEPSERFPQPPAPKLVAGYNLVRQYGCYGCHEITGYDGPKRIGPDLRAEPHYSEAASQVLTDPGLSNDERNWATKLVAHPADSSAERNELLRSIKADAELAKPQPESGNKPAGKPRLTATTHALADALKDDDQPGKFRRVGVSLRHLNSKVDFNWVYSWIRRPSDFRPTTRMPQFFLNYEHLDNTEKAFPIHDASGKEVLVTDLEYTKRFEHIEIRALAAFLLKNSQRFEYIHPPQGITEAPSKERGKKLFETRGCLACHSHVDFPGIHSTQGPDLSRLSAKLNTEKGQRWLYSWLKAPNHYFPRTAMPNLFLDPIAETDAAGKPTGHVTDPAADIEAFLLSVPADWKPEEPAPAPMLTADEKQALNDLTTVWLSASFPRRRAEEYAKNGIPQKLEGTIKIDEKALLGGYKDDNDRAQRQLEYVARRSIGRYGCFGCHDIPGYETAKPIGTPLADWGRKDSSKLAFENIEEFLATHGEYVPKRDTYRSSPSEHPGASASEKGEINPLDDKYDADTGYFLQSINSHERNGFLWQKLRMPRSFDYQTTRTKRYDERLRMPKFPFNAKEREEVMTFILGLTSETPSDKYVYKPGPREEAIIQGRHVLDKYNCAGCHILDMDRWDIAYTPKSFEPPPTTNDYPFIRPDIPADKLKASLKPDHRGLLHTELYGMPALDEKTGQPRLVDSDGVPIEPDDKESPRFYEFIPFTPTVIDGIPRMVGVQTLRIPAASEGVGPAKGKGYPGHGGDLTKYLFSRVIADEKKSNPNVVASEAWGWLPPPLHHEGSKVQADWLHDFLMDPVRIRPAVVLRMPNFHMSSDEASKLVNYFAAKSNAAFPYEYDNRRRQDYLAGLEQSHPARLNDAMKIVTNSNYCVKCHSVGDYQVHGSQRGLGPNLDQVYRRLRPEYVRRWIADPQRTLPYTGMPVNIPYDSKPPHYGGVSQELFPGTSVAQLDGVVDLLMNFDEYTRRQTSVKGLVKEQAPAGQPPAAQPPATQPPNTRAPGG
ncbi:MAG TPA: PDZ domain-containing protein [Lacipirellulaceae bacterium]|nr:PDZ domain-containing protein [Lacipirellulaceae bacterium]